MAAVAPFSSLFRAGGTDTSLGAACHFFDAIRMKRRKGPPCALPSNADNDSTIPNKGYFSARCAKALPKRPSSGTFYLKPFRAAGRGSMNHEQAMLMKSSRVSDLNTPWEQVLHLASRRVFPKRHTIDVSNTESPYFYYILSGTVRLGLCRSQRRGTDDPVRRGGHAHERADHHRRGHQEHRGDLHGTGGSRDFRRRAADGSRVRRRPSGFAAQPHPLALQDGAAPA